MRTVVIDCFPESVSRYRHGYAIVAIDVIRATTMAVTCAALGRRCFPVPTIEAAVLLAKRLRRPLLAGELGGNMPYGFDMNNSPADLERRSDPERPLILVSSSGTQVIVQAAGCREVYLGCFRNYSALAAHLAGRCERIALIGAGSRGEFREEDQICCAWIAAGLMEAGYAPLDERTGDIARLWRDAPPEASAEGKSADYLRRSGQARDLDFILDRVDDLDAVFRMRDGEVVMEPVAEHDVPQPGPVLARKREEDTLGRAGAR